MVFNLFSIFDPSTPLFMSMNWLAVPVTVLLVPKPFWLVSPRMKKMVLLTSSYMMSELTPLSKKNKYTFITSVSLFMLILLTNILGLLPFFFTSSSHMSFTTSMALTFWISLILFMVKNNLNSMMAHLVPSGSPSALIPFMVLIELISNCMRPLTLAVRLAANMTAGHLLMVLLSSAMLKAPALYLPFILPFQIFLISLELAVALIQAYVFSVLSTLYLSESSV
uniref:ATP synthase subunit a n=1 Tax=Crangonyx forbesi TaxID=111557 RepID=A0A6C0X4X7_9CRUS|nr:ATP synthase F0 subunit 6 [Crangonyx forbesi]